MGDWKKIPDKKCPYYLQIREGKFRTSYRVFYRAHGLNLREVLEGDFSGWKEALGAADKIIYKARFGERAEERAQIRNEEIAKQLIAESAGQDQATIEGKTNIFENHLIPWLNEHYPYANSLTVETWPRYKLFKRQGNASMSLQAHVKYFRMLANRVFELGLVKPKIKIRFNVKKEEFREPGRVIPDDELARIIEVANFRKSLTADGKPSHGQGPRVWYCRIITQRDTGMRPGEVRELRKGPVTLPNGRVLPANVEFVDGALIVRLFEEDTKTHRYREFLVRSQRVLEALTDRARRHPESPYFFPMAGDPSRPMDKDLGTWAAILKRAKVTAPYTPHDLRHSYATEWFQKTKNYATLCYQLDMSLEMAQETYLHLSAKDTSELADMIAARATPVSIGEKPNA